MMGKMMPTFPPRPKFAGGAGGWCVAQEQSVLETTAGGGSV